MPPSRRTRRAQARLDGRHSLPRNSRRADQAHTQSTRDSLCAIRGRPWPLRQAKGHARAAAGGAQAGDRRARRRGERRRPSGRTLAGSSASASQAVVDAGRHGDQEAEARGVHRPRAGKLGAALRRLRLPAGPHLELRGLPRRHTNARRTAELAVQRAARLVQSAQLRLQPKGQAERCLPAARALPLALTLTLSQTPNQVYLRLCRLQTPRLTLEVDGLRLAGEALTLTLPHPNPNPTVTLTLPVTLTLTPTPTLTLTLTPTLTLTLTRRRRGHVQRQRGPA